MICLFGTNNILFFLLFWISGSRKRTVAHFDYSFTVDCNLNTTERLCSTEKTKSFESIMTKAIAITTLCRFDF